MMVDVLDCTLRDGGYYTNWDFDDDLVETYLLAMAGSPVGVVELGYRSPPKGGYLGQYYYLPRQTIEHCRSVLRPDQKIAIMFNEKDVSAEAAPGLLADLVGLVDIIRFAVAPDQLERAKTLATACRSLGFEVAVNVMYLNKYVHDTAFLGTLADADVDYVSLVDSYGGCMPDEVATAVKSTVALLPQPIGFHGHDNINMAFANALAAMGAGAKIVDSTVQGMGRGAGNLNTEVISAYLHTKADVPVDFGRLSTASAVFGEMKKEFGWGSNLAYQFSGFAGSPQADVMDWLGTRRYQLDSIVQALRQQGGGAIDDVALPVLSEATEAAALKGKPVVILGGGDSVLRHKRALADFIAQEDAVIIHSSTRHAAQFDGFHGHQAYCLAGQDLQRLAPAQRPMLAKDGRIVATPPPPRFPDSTPEGARVFQVSNDTASPDRPRLGPVADEAPLDLALAVADDLDATVVYLAGFDGYEIASTADRHNAQDVQTAIDAARAARPERKLLSLTPTHYDVQATSVYGHLKTGEPKLHA